MRVSDLCRMSFPRAPISALAFLAAFLPGAAFAQDPAPSDSLAVNILRALVAKGVLSKKDAQTILTNAQTDTQKARAATVAATPTATPTSPAPTDASVIRVPYVPENVRQDIEDKVRADVLAEEQNKNWAKPGIFPDWINRFTPFGDFRFRDESRFFDRNNFYGFVNANTFNGSGPFDINNSPFPILNSLKNRNLLQIRARLGFTADITDGVSTTFMLASGNDNGPISTTQTLGSDFSKKNVYLDQAYLTLKPTPNATLWFGRFPNPFVSVEDLFKQDDFQLDGVAAQYRIQGPVNAYITTGAFPIQYSTDDFPTTAPATLKTSDKQKWLFGGQAGFEYPVTPRFKASFNVAYYDFMNLQNEPSSCQYNDFFCFSQNSQPNYIQKGNTLLFLMPNDTNPTTGASPQFLGLASKFEELDFLGKFDFKADDKTHIILIGDYVKNLGFDQKQILANAGGINGLATNNETCILPPGVSLAAGQSCAARGGHNVFRSGNTAWLARLIVGQPVIHERWDWSLAGAYLYIDPDAVVDAFDDKDFRLGGTNSKGFIVEGDLGVAHNTWLTLKYLSADVIDGPAFSVDVLQFDINTRF